MLGYGIAGPALFFTLWLPFDAIYPSLGDVITDFIFIGAAYFLYKAVMSPSPVGRVESVVEEQPNRINIRPNR